MGAIIFVLGSGVSTQEVEWKAQLILGLTLDLKFIQSLLYPFSVTALGRKCLLASSLINRLYSDSMIFFLCWCVEGVRETERHKIQRRCAPGSPFTQKRLSVPRRREPRTSSVRSREERSYSVRSHSPMRSGKFLCSAQCWYCSRKRRLADLTKVSQSSTVLLTHNQLNVSAALLTPRTFIRSGQKQSQWSSRRWMSHHCHSAGSERAFRPTQENTLHGSFICTHTHTLSIHSCDIQSGYFSWYF